MQEKSREQKLRRAAKRQGLIAQKGRSEPYGWWIIDASTNTVCAGALPTPFSLSLEEAEAYIFGSDGGND